MAEKKKVRFIRKKWRIIPITQKERINRGVRKGYRKGAYATMSNKEQFGVKPKTILLPKKMSRYALDHEFGHAKASEQKGTANWKMKKSMNRPSLLAITGPYRSLFSEHEATKRAY